MAFTTGETLGAYQITDRLGQGGMATVYRAYQPRLDRYVAIKALHPAFKTDPTFIDRFDREARIIAKLEHAHIVPVFDAGEHDGQPYLVMKFIEGETLKARLNRGPLELDEAIRLVEAIGGALQYAHTQGILHRDIKPSNILIEKSTNYPYLADFGLARMADAGESTMSQDVMLGTPHYISPEQAQGLKDLDAGTDIYSFGVVLYEIMVGRVPFNADTPYAIVHDHIFAALPLPSKVNPNVPRAVETVLLRALAKNRKDRYESAGALAAAFKQAVTESGLETMPSGSYRVPFPPDSKVTYGTTELETPRPSSAAPGGTIALPIPSSSTGSPINTGTQSLNPAISGTTSNPGSTASLAQMSDQLRSFSELRRIERRRRQRANIWIFTGFAGLVLTFLAGTIVVVSAFADSRIRADLASVPIVISANNTGWPPPTLAPTPTSERDRPRVAVTRIGGAIATRNSVKETADAPQPTTVTSTPIPPSESATVTGTRTARLTFTPDPKLSPLVDDLINARTDSERDSAAQKLYEAVSKPDRRSDLVQLRLIAVDRQLKEGRRAELAAIVILASYKLDEKDHAQRQLSEALKASPNSVALSLISGVIAIEEGKTEEAKKQLATVSNSTLAPEWMKTEAKRLLKKLS